MVVGTIIAGLWLAGIVDPFKKQTAKIKAKVKPRKNPKHEEEANSLQSDVDSLYRD